MAVSSRALVEFMMDPFRSGLVRCVIGSASCDATLSMREVRELRPIEHENWRFSIVMSDPIW